jgi:ketosteroid isomerase-like protein
MTDPKIAAIRRVYEAFGRGDISFILDQLTDDVDWASCPGSDIAPWHGIHRGKAEVREHPAVYGSAGGSAGQVLQRGYCPNRPRRSRLP